MKKVFRKIATVAGTALLIGSTVGMAAAVSYPNDTAVVYGAGAATSDMTAAMKIATNVQSGMAVETTTATVEGGDSYMLEKSSTKFNLGDTITEVISTKVTDDNLPTLLADGKYIDNDNDEFDYTQKIELNGTTKVEMFEDNDYKSDIPTVGIKIPNGKLVMNYTLDFTDDPLWADIATSDVPLMGKEYYVLDNSSVVGDSITLLDAAATTVLTEGETATLSVDGKAYTVSIEFISSTETKLTVNGEVTNTLEESQTYKLDDGAYLGVKDILYSSKDTGVSKVELSIGSGKLVLTDGQDVELNEVSISDLKVNITHDATKLQSIRLDWLAEDDLFVVEDSEVTMPGFGNVKLSFGGLTYPTEETISVENDGDDSIVLNNFPLKDSTEDINVLYFDNTNYTLIGKDSDNLLVTSGDTNLTFDGDTDDWFAVSYNDTKDSESYLMRATNFKNESGTNKTTIQYRSDGAWTDVKTDVQPADDVTLGSVEFSIVTIDEDGKSVGIGSSTTGVSFNRIYSNEGLAVQLPWINTTAVDYTGLQNSDNDTLVKVCALIDAYSFGAGQLGYNKSVSFNLTGTGDDLAGTTGYCESFPATYTLNLTEEDKNENLGSGNVITVTLADDTNNEVSVTGVNMGTNKSASTQIEDSKVYRNFAYSELATEAMWDKSADQYKVALTYHGEEVTAAVYVNSAEAVVSSTSELGVKTVTDTEVSTVSSSNLIVVGGSAINSVAAELLGGSFSEGDFTEATGVGADQYMIATYASPYSSSKTATLVAGYEAQDTTRAADDLVTSDISLEVGQSVVKTSVDMATVA